MRARPPLFFRAARLLARRAIPVSVALAVISTLLGASAAETAHAAAAAATPAAAAAPAAPAAPAPATAAPRKVTGWLPHWATDANLAAFQANAALFSDVSPFWYTAHGATTIQDHADPAYKQAVIATARQAGVPILPAISDESGKRTMAGILADPAQRGAHVATIVRLVLNNGYDGIDIDYEQFAYADGRDTWPGTINSWTVFVQELATALHAQGKLLAVTVPPTYDTLAGPNSGYWVYNYPAIGQAADRVRIMAYDFSVPTPGPIAPLNWVQSITNFAVTMIPPQKVQLGIPAYGREWMIGQAGSCSGAMVRKHSYTPDEFNAIAAAHYATPVWDPATGEKTYIYNENNGVCAVNRVVSYVDADGLTARKAIADAAGLAGIAIWTVGGVEARAWEALRAEQAALTPAAPAPAAPAEPAPAVPFARSTMAPKRVSTYLSGATPNRACHPGQGYPAVCTAR